MLLRRKEKKRREKKRKEKRESFNRKKKKKSRCVVCSRCYFRSSRCTKYRKKHTYLFFKKPISLFCSFCFQIQSLSTSFGRGEVKREVKVKFIFIPCSLKSSGRKVRIIFGKKKRMKKEKREREKLNAVNSSFDEITSDSPPVALHIHTYTYIHRITYRVYILY